MQGDIVQLGEVFLKVLSDEIDTTLVMDEDDAAKPKPKPKKKSKWFGNLKKKLIGK